MPNPKHLWSALVAIGLAVPAIVVIDLFTGMDVVLGLDGTDVMVLVLICALSMLTFGGIRTKSNQCAV